MSDKIKESRYDIYSLRSSASAGELSEFLMGNVYASASQWKRFLNLLLPALGISFIISGVIFFFAYNWADIGRFAKFGGVGILLIGAVGLAVMSRWQLLVRQLMLMAACCMVGVLFAVYGQAYQTGADSYELFLNWVLAITVWVVVGRFAPLWLLWIVLVNLTAQLYAEQRLGMYSDVSEILPALLALFLAVCVVVTEVLCVKGFVRKRPWWFVNALFLAVCIYDINFVATIIGRHNTLLPLFGGVVSLVVVGGGFVWGWVKHNLFYVSISAFSGLILLMILLVDVMDKSIDVLAVILFIGLICVIGTTAIIVMITRLKRLWNGR